MNRNRYREILEREFVIDTPAVVLPGPSRAVRRCADAGTGRGDLLTQVVEMLKEQERLESLARDLASRGTTDEGRDLQRLFRRALVVLDSFDRIIMFAEQHPPTEEVQNWLKSVAAIQARMTELFGEFGLHPMDPVGKRVNLDRHEVVEVRHTDSLPDETVVEVRQKGYLLHGKVFRDARVVVAQNPNR